VRIASAPPKIDAEDAEPARSGKETEALVALWAWYSEWFETARVVIKRRDQFIRLGLAKRKKAATKSAEQPGEAVPG
jgi:hypothetical protein